MNITAPLGLNGKFGYCFNDFYFDLLDRGKDHFFQTKCAQSEGKKHVFIHLYCFSSFMLNMSEILLLIKEILSVRNAK